MRVSELHKLRQEQAMKIGNVSDDAQEAGLATTDGIMFPKSFCKGVLTYWDMCLRLSKPKQNTVCKWS